MNAVRVDGSSLVMDERGMPGDLQLSPYRDVTASIDTGRKP
jgi:hypothetical protein